MIPLKFILISMFSHGIPNTSDEDEADGALNDPKNQNRFHTGNHSSSDTEIRRAGEQTSPQVARAAGHPARRDEGGGLINGS